MNNNIESKTFPDYKKSISYLFNLGFSKIGYVQEEPTNQFFVEEFKHEDGRTARLLNMTFMSWYWSLKTMDTHLVQIKIV